MSNLLNSLAITLNASKGYNPYRNADGTFANGPVTMGTSSLAQFADRSASGEKGNAAAVKDAQTSLQGMLRLGVNIKNNGNYLNEVEAAKTSSLADKIKEAQAKQGGFDNRHFGDELTTIYKKLSKPASDVSKNLTKNKQANSTTIKALEKIGKDYAGKIGKIKGDGADVYDTVYGYAAAIANTLRAVGLDGNSSK